MLHVCHVDEFVQTFDIERNVLITRALGMSEEIINSSDTDYVMLISLKGALYYRK